MRLLAACLLFGFQLQLDSATLVDNRITVEPMGVTLDVPRCWVRLPDVGPRQAGCANYTGAPAVFTSREELARLGSPAGQFQMQFASVVDSVMPLASLIAHVGATQWGLANGGASPQVRVYSTTESRDSIHVRTGRIVVQFPAGGRLIPPRATTRDSAEWRITKVEWNYAASDYSAGMHTEFRSRSVRGRTLVVVLMRVGTNTEPAVQSVIKSIVIR